MKNVFKGTAVRCCYCLRAKKRQQSKPITRTRRNSGVSLKANFFIVKNLSKRSFLIKNLFNLFGLSKFTKPSKHRFDNMQTVQGPEGSFKKVQEILMIVPFEEEYSKLRNLQGWCFKKSHTDLVCSLVVCCFLSAKLLQRNVPKRFEQVCWASLTKQLRLNSKLQGN